MAICIQLYPEPRLLAAQRLAQVEVQSLLYGAAGWAALTMGVTQGNRIKSAGRTTFALKGQSENSPVASALGFRRRISAGVLKGRLIVYAQLVQSSFQDFRALCPARNPRAEASNPWGSMG